MDNDVTNDVTEVRRCIIITGMSGAGKSTALKVLEDQGMFAIDNIPSALLPQLILLLGKHRAAVKYGVAAVVDVRGETLLDDFPTAVATLKSQFPRVDVLFLDADDGTLLRRFEFTRRRHPLGRESSFLESITDERKRLKRVLDMADTVIDTSRMSLGDLQKRLLSEYCDEREGVSLVVTSFGFKYGAPADCDYLFDVRFLPNPYYLPELQPLSGLDGAVQEYIWRSADASGFWDRMVAFLEYVVPLYLKSGKSHLHIGIGCTGGRHRSVTVAERLYRHFDSLPGGVSLRHRDMGKDQGW